MASNGDATGPHDHACEHGDHGEHGEHGEDGPPADLSHAGAVVDKAIEYMAGQNIGSLAIASALLGGAMGMLSRSLGDEAIIRILDNAIASVKAGELRHIDGGGRA